MSKKNLHIKKYLNGKLPEPEVQADDAWAKMDDMLSGNPVPETQVSTVSKLKFLLKGGLGIITAVGIATSIWFLVPEEKVKNIVKHTNESNLDSSDAFPSLPENTQKELGIAKKEQKIHSLQNPEILKEEEKKEANSEKPPVINDAISISREIISAKTDFGNLKNGQKRNNDEINLSKTQFAKSSSSARIKADLEVNHTHSKNAGEYSGIAEKIENKDSGSKPNRQTSGTLPDNLTRYDFSSSKNNAKINSGKIDAVSENRFMFPEKTLLPKSVQFNNLVIKQTRPVSYNQPVSTQNSKTNKEKKPLIETLHVGLQWNAASSFNSTKYIFKGTDSTSKPYLLIIPGIWISKDISENQLVQFSFYANQHYYGGSGRIQRLGSDSALFHNNINLIKATGINLALQYEYRFLQNITASGGLSYSPLRKALAQDDYENYQGIIIHGPKLLLDKQNIRQYMNTNLFMFKTGLAFSTGRYQLGANILIPVSNLSLTPTSSLRTLNGQFFFRYTIK